MDNLSTSSLVLIFLLSTNLPSFTYGLHVEFFCAPQPADQHFG